MVTMTGFYVFDELTPVYFIGPESEKRPREAYFPQPGFVCKVKWSDPKFKRGWVKDGYVGKADGSRKKKWSIKTDSFLNIVLIFKLVWREDPEAFTKAFNKRAFERPYSGDVLVVNEKYCHGYAKTKQKFEKPFFPPLN